MGDFLHNERTIKTNYKSVFIFIIVYKLTYLLGVKVGPQCPVDCSNPVWQYLGPLSCIAEVAGVGKYHDTFLKLIWNNKNNQYLY